MRARTVGTILACLLVLALLAAPAVFANTAIGYVAPVAAVVMLLLCFAYLMLVKRSIRFEEQGPDDGSTRGDVLNFALTVHNRSFLPLTRAEVVFCITDLFGGEGRTETRLVTLPPRSHKTFDLGVRFDHIGEYRVGINRITVYDPLGVFYSMRSNDELHEVMVEPRPVDLAGLEISDRSLQESSKNIRTFINDGMDYSGVREYHWGDPMKSIHWKLSSKEIDSYLTRMYETPTTPGVALFMDFESPEYDAETLMDVYDAVVEASVSAELYASRSGYETDVYFVNEAGEDRRITGSLDGRYANLMDRIPRISVGDGKVMMGLLMRASGSIYCQNNLIVCSACITNSLMDTLIQLSSPTRFPYLVAVIPDEGEGVEARRASLKRLNAAGIPYACIRRASDLVGGGA